MFAFSEEDEFDILRLPKAAHKEITEQLIKDGYNLDLEPDDEDLDLIPPRPLKERCSCCTLPVGCSIQWLLFTSSMSVKLACLVVCDVWWYVRKLYIWFVLWLWNWNEF